MSWLFDISKWRNVNNLCASLVIGTTKYVCFPVPIRSIISGLSETNVPYIKNV